MLPHVKSPLRPTLSIGRLLFLCILLLCGIGCSEATSTQTDESQGWKHPFLFRIEGEKPSYLFGTVHVPDDRILNVPDGILQAIQSSDAFYAELPMHEVDASMSAQRGTLEDGKTLEDVLPKTLYERLETFLKKRRHSIQSYQSFKPWMVVFNISMLDFADALLTKEPLDRFLYSLAQDSGKKVGGLETLDEQLNVFEGFSQKENCEILEATLDEIEEVQARGETYGDFMVEAYLSGDLQDMFEQNKKQMADKPELFEKYIERLLTRRNKNMAARIANHLKAAEGQGIFFAIGALHLEHPAGEGIVDGLRARGLTVERVALEALESAK